MLKRTNKTLDESDLQLERAETSRAIRDGIIAMLVAMLLLLVFNSAGLRSWARNLPGSTVSDVIVSCADRWHAVMREIGATVPKAAVQNAVSDFRDYEWSDAAGSARTAGHGKVETPGS